MLREYAIAAANPQELPRVHRTITRLRDAVLTNTEIPTESNQRHADFLQSAATLNRLAGYGGDGQPPVPIARIQPSDSELLRVTTQARQTVVTKYNNIARDLRGNSTAPLESFLTPEMINAMQQECLVLTLKAQYELIEQTNSRDDVG